MRPGSEKVAGTAANSRVAMCMAREKANDVSENERVVHPREAALWAIGADGDGKHESALCVEKWARAIIGKTRGGVEAQRRAERIDSEGAETRRSAGRGLPFCSRLANRASWKNAKLDGFDALRRSCEHKGKCSCRRGSGGGHQAESRGAGGVCTDV